ncbi:MAG: ammonia-forming cytochrome c nitrite reductase subunit c552 [Planctomycetota bacterium]|nr:ammonia-forming cytochrome c nitrite reductase subunit c552 [Planctomycetota bacterium]
MTQRPRGGVRMGTLIVLLLAVAAGAGGAMLIANIAERKAEGKNRFVRVQEVDEDTTDPALWGRNWPAQYDSFLLTQLPAKEQFGGGGGSEALPEQKAETYPWLTRIFQGYAFAIDYREARGHAYMLSDQEVTKRHKVSQSGSCLHCHASVMPLYRELGDGDATEGFKKSHKLSYQEANKQLHDLGHAHPMSCGDCHDPDSMALRVTRPGFILGIQALAKGDAPVPHIPSIENWRKGSRKKPYDPNVDSSRQEMRSFVCGQCHVEYYCGSGFELTFPWGYGMDVDQQERFWDETKLPNGERFYDYKHKETGAEILKAQHPEYELWSQGIHARSGVSCADCHMPYQRSGASKVSDHWVRSPLTNVNRACQVCHNISETEILSRVESIQSKTHELLKRGGNATVDLIDAILEARAAGASEEDLKPALEMQRKAQWRLDWIVAENSVGFHAPQEAARILAEAADYARQGQVLALRAKEKAKK